MSSEMDPIFFLIFCIISVGVFLLWLLIKSTGDVRIDKYGPSESARRRTPEIRSRGNLGYPEIDLHGLIVYEAIKEIRGFLLNYLAKDSRVIIITGRGLNSPGGEAKIKPAVIEWLDEHNYEHYDVYEGGALEVKFRRF